MIKVIAFCGDWNEINLKAAKTVSLAVIALNVVFTDRYTERFQCGTTTYIELTVKS